MPGHITSHNMILRQQPRTVKKEGAGIGLPYEVRREMALMLDDHQCALSVALHQYNKHHWLSEGAESFLSLHELLDEHIDKTKDHIDAIGERVARLGGVPTVHDLMDFGTVEVLEEVLRDRENLGYHLFSVLEDDTLVRGMEHLVKKKGNIAGDGVVNKNNKLQ